MARNMINRYVWLVDTISRYGRITLKDLNAAWLRSEISEGKPLARRTFFHYRDGVEEMFDINIQCDKATFEYYIDDTGGEENARLLSWLVDSVSMSGTLSNARDISSRIMLENVPSAREHLPVVIDALKQNRRIRFSYKSYTRALPTDGIVLEPYFVKIFKQLWYVIGLNVKDNLIKTYSLDRMSNPGLLCHARQHQPVGVLQGLFRHHHQPEQRQAHCPARGTHPGQILPRPTAAQIPTGRSA